MRRRPPGGAVAPSSGLTVCPWDLSGAALPREPTYVAAGARTRALNWLYAARFIRKGSASESIE